MYGCLNQYIPSTALILGLEINVVYTLFEIILAHNCQICSVFVGVNFSWHNTSKGEVLLSIVY